MKFKLLVGLASLSLIGRIIFSIYFSIKIVDENTYVNRYQANLSQLTVRHQLLENDNASLTSLQHLSQQANLLGRQPITTSLDLSP